jgi:hypothetical protein
MENDGVIDIVAGGRVVHKLASDATATIIGTYAALPAEDLEVGMNRDWKKGNGCAKANDSFGRHFGVGCVVFAVEWW